MTAIAAPIEARRRRTALGRRASRLLLPGFTALLLLFLFAPIAVMIAFSFNDLNDDQ